MKSREVKLTIFQGHLNDAERHWTINKLSFCAVRAEAFVRAKQTQDPTSQAEAHPKSPSHVIVYPGFIRISRRASQSIPLFFNY
jgi:hypothetical protein